MVAAGAVVAAPCGGTGALAAGDAFIGSSEDVAPGTTMTFVGLASAQERADLIAYLADLPSEEQSSAAE